MEIEYHLKKVKANKVQEKVSNLSDYLKSWVKTFSGSLTLICLLILAFLPFLSQNQNFTHYILRQFTLAMIFSILAASWDFLTGIAGQISFGQAIFFGISGYISAYFISYQNYPIWLAFIIGAVGAAIFGLIIGLPALRLKGPYLALGTLVMNIILLKIFLLGSLEEIFFGSEGISALPKLSTNPIIEYLIVFIFMIAIFIIIFQITKSKFGTVLKSIRDDETGADASGINTTRYKVYAFMISALFAGIAGSFYALYTTSVNPSGNFGIIISFFAILMASLGGIATISGSAMGAFFFVLFEFALVEIGVIEIGAFSFDVGPWKFAIFAIILILTVRFAQNGILRPALEHLKDLWDVIIGR